MRVDISGRAIPRLPRREIEAFVKRSFSAIRRAGAAPGMPSEVSIAFLDDRAMAALNARFRGKRKTTDVLTFPSGEIEGDGSPLGDIAISIDQARRQAREGGHSLATEIRYLLLHGLLHASGHDHESDDGEMNALELAIRAKVGLE